MDDSAKRVLGGNAAQHHSQVGGIAGIAGHDRDLGAESTQVRLELGGSRGGWAAPRHQQQMADPVPGDHMLGKDPTQHSSTTGDQDRSIGIQPRRGVWRREGGGSAQAGDVGGAVAQC